MLGSLLRRWGAWFGIAVPGINFLVDRVVGLTQPHYDALAHYMSELSLPAVRYSALLRAWWIAIPVLFAPFLYSLAQGLQRRRVSSVAVAMLVVFSLGVSAAGVFPCDPGCRGLAYPGSVHNLTSAVVAWALAVATPTFGLAIRDDPRWRHFHWVNATFIGLGWAAGLALYAAEIGLLRGVAGLCERLFYGVYGAWFVVIAVHLMRMRQGNRADAMPRTPPPRRRSKG